MYAVVATGGQQFKVSEGDTITVKRLVAEVGTDYTLSEVLLVGGDEVKVGAPHVDGASVTAEVVAHSLGDKRDIFKYRRTRRSRVGNGFRPAETTLTIKAINA